MIQERSQHRGHPMFFDGVAWRYEDDGSLVSEGWRVRPCRNCGEAFTVEGHDPCIANLPGVQNACCGHGVDREAYVQFDNGLSVRGALAVGFFAQVRA